MMDPAKLKQLVGKRVESASMDKHGVIRIVAAGLGGRVVVLIDAR